MKEIWKKVDSLPNHEISNFGNVRYENSKKPVPNHIHWKGYVMFNVGKKHYRVHRIVLETFVGKSELQVNHKNGIKTDNNITNLEYVTGIENIQHAFDCGLWNHRMKKVSQFDMEGRIIKTFKSHSEAARELGFDQGAISRCVRGEYKSYKGYVWRTA